NGSRQGNESANGVNNRGACEIMKARAQRRQEIPRAAHGCQKSVRSPGPVADDRVNEPRDRETVEQIPDKSGTTNHGAGRNGGTGIRKRKLEEPEGQKRYAGGLIGGRHIVQEEPVHADEAVTVTEHERETERVK